jgi:hypothetical protein
LARSLSGGFVSFVLEVVEAAVRAVEELVGFAPVYRHNIAMERASDGRFTIRRDSGGVWLIHVRSPGVVVMDRPVLWDTRHDRK